MSDEPHLTLDEQRQNGRACYELAVEEMRKALRPWLADIIEARFSSDRRLDHVHGTDTPLFQVGA